MSLALYECPADGCSWGPEPEQSVCAHYSGKQDGAHSGGYQKARSLLEDAEPVGSADVNDEPDPDPDVDADVQEPGDDDRPEPDRDATGNPIVDGPDPDPDAGGADDDEPSCPECGGSNWFDASDPTDGEYQYGCGDCSERGGTWVVWNE